MIKVYIASAYTVGNAEKNVWRSINCANELMNAGFAPFTPLLYHYINLIYPRSYSDWMQLDIEWLSTCDACLRLKGESSGADEEVEYARNNDIPVFYTIEQLKDYYYDQATKDDHT